MSTKGKKSSGQFAEGTSGNPSGRPAGSRNKATLLMEALLEGEAEQLTAITPLTSCLTPGVHSRLTKPSNWPRQGIPAQ